jgi:hypothetical protein
MAWIKKDKVLFRDQPALLPEETGVPGLRQYLFVLPATNNLLSYQKHIYFDVPFFLKKIRRVVDTSERDIGFRTLADAFDKIHPPFISQVLNYTKQHFFKNIVKISMQAMRADSPRYKEQVNDLVTKHWMELKAQTMNRILKSKGVVPPGTSRAKGLEYGCDWNLQLAKILSPGFKAWCAAQARTMRDIESILVNCFYVFHNNVMATIDQSAAGVSATEKAKSKYKPIPQTIKAKLMGIMPAIKSKQEQLLLRATMEDGRQNSFIATITDSMYDDIFKAVPALKGSSSG